MKLVFAIITTEDSQNVIPNLLDDGYSVTTIASTGGFFRAGNTTIMIGCEDDKLETLKEDIKKYTTKRHNVDINETPAKGRGKGTINVGGATMFIMDVEREEKY